MSRVYVAYDASMGVFLTDEGEDTEEESEAGQWRNSDILREFNTKKDLGAEGFKIIPRRARSGNFVDHWMP